MIIFLYGPDTYRSRRKLNEIIAHYKKIHKSGLNLKYPEKLEDLKETVKQSSMFKEKKLAVITNIFSDSEFKEKFLENKKEFLNSEDIILFYQEGEVNKNDPLLKLLKKNAKCQEFNLLQGDRLQNWIKKEFDKYNAKIDSGALAKLVEYIGNDLWRMSNEIKKLASYKKELGSFDIELLVRPKIETDIFRTIDAIAERNKKLALKLLHKHLEEGDSPLYLLSMINYQFRNILIVKSSNISRIKMHPYVLRKSYYQSQRFTLEEIKKIYQKIFEVDLNIKTGKMEPETALDLLITEI